MRRLIFALAAIAAGAVFADKTTVFSQNFDSAAEGDDATTVGFALRTTPEPAAPFVGDNSTVVAHEGTPTYVVGKTPGANYFEVDTGSNTLYKSVSNANYLDTMVQFQITKNPEEPTDYQIALYLTASSNLMAFVSGAAEPVQVASGIEEEKWYRLTIGKEGNYFKVYLDGVYKDTGTSLASTGDIESVDVKGSGALDDFALCNYNPLSTDVTISWPSGLTDVQYSTDGSTWTSVASGSSLVLTYAPEETVPTQFYLKGSVGGFVKEFGAVNVSNNEAAFTGDTTSLAFYFPRTATAGQNGTTTDHPYEIATANDILALQTAVTNVAGACSLCYKLTANIDMSSVGAFDGIGTADGKNFQTSAFKGTFDGAGKTISNVTLSAAKYRGFFNQVQNGTIKDLTINVVDIGTGSDEHGYAAFVGNMQSSTIIRCKATGTLGTVAKPTMHSTAGFAVKVDSAGVFVDCTNEVDIVCSLNDNPKVGGFVGLMQGGALTNCVNKGDITITCKKCANTGNGAGGLVGYAQTGALEIYGGGNTGAIQTTDTTADGGSYDVKVGTIIGMQNNSAATISGDVKAQANAAPAGAFANISGLSFATVDNNNVATFVADNALAAGNTYKVMNSAATATYEFAAAGTIAFDTALATPTYAITAPNLKLTDVTSGSVKTYTAAAYANWTITLSAANTTVTGISNGQTVNEASPTVSFTVAPDPGYSVTSVTAGGSTLTPADGTYSYTLTGNVTITVATENTSVPVVSDKATTLVSVPQDCKASELINTSNRDPGDALKVYSKTAKKYYTWELNASKEWVAVDTVVVSGDGATQAQTPAASTVDLTRGEAVWVTRKNTGTGKDIILNAAYSNEPVQVSVEKGWNLVAPTPKAGETKIDLNDALPAGASGDQVKVPTAGAPITCVYDSTKGTKGEWGYWRFTKENGRVTGKEWVSDVEIDAGTGVWYISGSNKDIEIK